MTVIRRNILESDDARDRYLAAVVELNQANTGITVGSIYEQLQELVPLLRIYGTDQELSVWDVFVIWHYLAMQIVTPPLEPLRNLAHGGPIFLPWHRLFLIRLEEQLQRVTDADTALPYWDWAVHGELPETAQREHELWGEHYLGESGGQVTSGPLGAMRLRIEDRGDALYSVDERRLVRNAGVETPKLPTIADLNWALEDENYDESPWSAGAESFRNKVEGWLQRPPTAEDPELENSQLHNRVHVWVAGDMFPGTSPNDPVFYLNHCNEDRIWERWMAKHGRKYQPTVANADAPVGHRLDDIMVTLLGEPLRPADVLDASSWYTYDDLGSPDPPP
jgi:tyrosinase